MIPEPAPVPLSPQDRFAATAWNAITAALNATCADELRGIHADLVFAAGVYAAQLAEEIARPDDRWGPQ